LVLFSFPKGYLPRRFFFHRWGFFYFFFFIGLAGFFMPGFAIFGGRPRFEPYVPLPIGIAKSFLYYHLTLLAQNAADILPFLMFAA
jgi:hypothetical protein